jgi:hypothetical protein
MSDNGEENEMNVEEEVTAEVCILFCLFDAVVGEMELILWTLRLILIFPSIPFYCVCFALFYSHSWF